MLQPEQIATVQAWMESRGTAAGSGLKADVLHGGHSNITYQLRDDAGHRWVLRTPPTSGVLETAHDMGREHLLMTALSGTMPVPAVIGYESDASLIGTKFLVMDFVDGLVPRDGKQMLEKLTARQRRTASESIVDTLAELHRIPPDEVGLRDLGKPTGYIHRQLTRWKQQWDVTRTADSPDIDTTYQLLLDNIPPQQRTSILHGDFRLDNTVLGADGTVAAVLDWELATRGDPLADLASLILWWTEPGESNSLGYPGPTSAPDMLTRKQVIARYVDVTELDIGALDYYLAFVHWRTVCVAQGVLSRRLSGALGEESHVDIAKMRSAVLHHAETAAEFAAAMRATSCR
ncbi:phosphotransferase family protein [Rhodococcus opacus]|uniref:phosphotransferase family protein n=1 Tax=Rhodococcus opacus TaxID=37919 RepID=UPI000A54B363|nr:phosphotransferase family protein [Rhodococcus opacus]